MQNSFNLTGHKKLWNWLAENPDKQKEQWPGWKRNGGEYENDGASCFACEYAKDNKKDCPLVIGNDCGRAVFFSYPRCLGGLFIEWDFSQDTNKRSQLAAQIRDLPVREGVECV